MTAEFSADEKKRLAPFFTNLDQPVFGLKLPQEVAGALFSRYSRSVKSLRRTFLDEFLGDPELGLEGFARRTKRLAMTARRSKKPAPSMIAYWSATATIPSRNWAARISPVKIFPTSPRSFWKTRASASRRWRSQRATCVSIRRTPTGIIFFTASRRSWHRATATDYLEVMNLLFDTYSQADGADARSRRQVAAHRASGSA